MVFARGAMNCKTCQHADAYVCLYLSAPNGSICSPFLPQSTVGTYVPTCSSVCHHTMTFDDTTWYYIVDSTSTIYSDVLLVPWNSFPFRRSRFGFNPTEFFWRCGYYNNIKNRSQYSLFLLKYCNTVAVTSPTEKTSFGVFVLYIIYIHTFNVRPRQNRVLENPIVFHIYCMYTARSLLYCDIFPASYPRVKHTCHIYHEIPNVHT